MQEVLQLSEAMFVVLLGRVKDHIVEVGYAAAGAGKAHSQDPGSCQE